MPALYYLSVSLHVLAAIVWLGGMFFFALVGAPVLRQVEPPELRSDLFQRLGRRFRTIGWILIAVLIATGLVNLDYRGLLRLELLGSALFWSSPMGRALGWKAIAVGTMIVCSAIHDFYWGPRSGRLSPDSTEAHRARRITSWIGRLNAVAGIVAVLAAVRLARGG